MVELGFLSGDVADHIAEAGTSRQLSKLHGNKLRPAVHFA